MSKVPARMDHDDPRDRVAERSIREADVLHSLANNPKVASAALEPSLYRLSLTLYYTVEDDRFVRHVERIGTIDQIENYAYNV